jgi:hypothetical protein
LAVHAKLIEKIISLIDKLKKPRDISKLVEAEQKFEALVAKNKEAERVRLEREEEALYKKKLEQERA